MTTREIRISKKVRDNIEAAATRYGWITTTDEPDRLVFEKQGPMIEQRDEKRVAIFFDPEGRFAGAFYGPDNRQHPLRTIEIVDHLTRIGLEITR